MRVAVITPYYQETDAVLLQCHTSVRRQTHPCTHFLIADGHPNPLFANDLNTVHIVLPAANGDNGNTPRAIGGILADQYGFDAVAYLDADNWYEPDHIANLLRARQAAGGDVIASRRRFYGLDGDFLAVKDTADETNVHVDTSCWLIFRPAFSLLRAWLMPKPLGPICDRIFYRTVCHHRFAFTITPDRTVAFRTQYADHYTLTGRPVPPGAKTDIFTTPLAYLQTVQGVKETVQALGFYPL